MNPCSAILLVGLAWGGIEVPTEAMAPTTAATQPPSADPSIAQAAIPASGSLALPPDSPPPTDEAEIRRRSHELARGLRCPVCQGLSSADSQAESAVAMRTRAEELVRQGYSDTQIKDYFVDRFGEWVLMEPPRKGRHWIVWLAPGVGLLLGGLWMGLRLRASKETPAPASAALTQDPYERKVLDELED